MIRKNIFLCLFLPLILSGCSLSVDTELAELAAADFHDSYNAGAYRVIYDKASPAFQDFISAGKFSHLLETLNIRLGQYKNSKLINWSSKISIRDGATVTLIYAAVYDKDEAAKVSFTFKVRDGLAQLYNFNVSSESMNPKKRPKTTEI